MRNAEDRSLDVAPGVVVDALNVAYWCGDPPDLRLPLALMAHLLERGHPVLLYFDASAPYKLKDDDRLIYQQLVQHPRHVVQVPSGRRADGVMLQHARSTGACIVSRDRFRDYRRRFRKLIDDPARLFGGAVAENVLHVPALGVEARLPGSSREAWECVSRALAGSAPSARGKPSSRHLLLHEETKSA
jgi:hypothetical protein